MEQAVIFDMDGVLLDSEPYWRQAQLAVLQPLGVPITEADAIATTGIRIDVIVADYFKRYPWQGPDCQQVTQSILDRLMELVAEHKPILPGVIKSLEYLKENGWRIGLASSSPMFVIKGSLAALGISNYFEELKSAESLRFGKPNPEVYINVADAMGVEPRQCIAIEDSVTGMIAAKAAQMTTIVVPDDIHKDDDRWVLADYRLQSLESLPDCTIFQKG